MDLGLNEEDESTGRCGCGSSRRSSCVITSARCLPGPTNRVRRTVQGRVDLVYESRMGCFGVQSLVEIQPNRGFGPVRPARRLDQAADGQAQAQTKTTEAEQILKKQRVADRAPCWYCQVSSQQNQETRISLSRAGHVAPSLWVSRPSSRHARRPQPPKQIPNPQHDTIHRIKFVHVRTHALGHQ